MSQLRLQTRRALSPAKLKRARLNAQYTNVAEVARLIGVERSTYLDWESERGKPLTHVDYIALSNALELFGVSYPDITNELADPAPALALAGGSA